MKPNLTILDLFKKEELQELQDAFANAAGLASLITDPRGNPVTRESKFTRLCNLIRQSPQGRENCKRSDEAIGTGDGKTAKMQPCLSCGIWDAGVPIIVGGVHVANWLIGQVRNDEISEKQVLAYADEIGADRDAYSKAFSEVPLMSLERFREAAEALVVIARNLSERAFNNVKQKQLLKEWSRTLTHLEESQLRNQAFLAAIPDLILRFDQEGVILDVHEGEESKALVAPELLMGKPLKDFVPPEIAKLTEEKLSLLETTGEMQVYDYSLPEEGRQRDFECRLVRSGKSEAMAIIRDVTDRNEAFRQLKGSLREKEVLIRELFHRTKNNMQMIRSLLSLQAGCYEDPQIVSALQEAEMRILAMALVHQQLYHSGDLSSIDLAGYIKELAGTIIENLTGEDLSIQLEQELSPLGVLIDVAIPVGLILNELISNSVRHGFRNRREGTIRIALSDLGEGTFLLQYRDDGEGPEDNFRLESQTTLGLQTVRILVQQLEGSIEWQIGQGLDYTLTLKNSGYKERV